MEDPPFATHPPQNSKRMFAGGSSNFDADVVEIPPPPTWKPKRLKHNSTIRHEVIVVDDDDSDDIVIIGKKGTPNDKGKKPVPNSHAAHKLNAKTGVPFPEAKAHSSAYGSFGGDTLPGFNFTDMSYDDCVMLQAHFDSLEVPTGVEATVPWWPASGEKQKLAATSSASNSSSLGMQASSAIGSSKVDQFKSWISHKVSKAKKSVFSQDSYESMHALYEIPKSPSDHVQPRFLVPPTPQWPSPDFPKHNGASSSPYKLHPSESQFLDMWDDAPFSTVNPVMDHGPGSTMGSSSSFFPQYNSPDRSIDLEDDISAHISLATTSVQGDSSENPLLKKLELFKKFDTSEDHSDHLYNNNKESVKQPKSWTNQIANEWRLLEKDLPDTIYVRVYEARMDLLRAAIVGADGTPYHDGLFFFDVYFTHTYPKSPPHVKYHSHGLRINPNLYDCGKVCLSLLGTWSGSGAENWRPGKSNMLQVLVSIQGLILNAEPYFNEPGYAGSHNTVQGKDRSKNYSENTFLLSLKTMLYTMKNPPKYFEDLVFGHFYKQAHDILEACRAYLNGVPVGGFVKGKSLADQTKTQTCSYFLKSSLPGYIQSLVAAFSKIGVKDCEKYLVPDDHGATVIKSAGRSRSSRSKKKH